MKALDTNVLARFYVDDPDDLSAAAQCEWAYQVLRDEPDLFVPLTVVLELEWVLRAFYDFGREEVVQVIQYLLGLRNVTLEDWPRIGDALEWHGQGLDFADALHLAAAPPARPCSVSMTAVSPVGPSALGCDPRLWFRGREAIVLSSCRFFVHQPITSAEPA